MCPWNISIFTYLPWNSSECKEQHVVRVVPPPSLSDRTHPVLTSPGDGLDSLIEPGEGNAHDLKCKEMVCQVEKANSLISRGFRCLMNDDMYYLRLSVCVYVQRTFLPAPKFAEQSHAIGDRQCVYSDEVNHNLSQSNDRCHQFNANHDIHGGTYVHMLVYVTAGKVLCHRDGCRVKTVGVQGSSTYIYIHNS